MRSVVFSLPLWFLALSCAPYALRQAPDVIHTYHLTIIDVDGKPLQGALVSYRLDEGAQHRPVKDTVVSTSETGKLSVSVTTSADPRFTYSASYSSKIEYKVSKDGYYSQTGSLSMFLEEKERTKSETVRLIKPTDYIDPTFLVSSKGLALKSKILSFIDLLRLQSLLSDSYLETQSINLASFKEKDYLAFKFINANTYNSLKLSKYDIGKTLFDEVVRKVLNPLNDNLGESSGFFGYDLTVIGFTKSFADKYGSSQKIVYRFLIPNEIVKKYKLKDISGQQVLDASVLLMDDERIDLKLQ